MFTVASTHPVDEKGLDEFDNFQCYQETDWYQVVEQDNEGEEVEAKVSSPAIYQGTNFLDKGKWYIRDSSLSVCKSQFVRWKFQKLHPANDQCYPNPENVLG